MVHSQVWGGLGTAIVCIYGALFLNETLDFSKAVYLVMITFGVVGLSLKEA